MTLDRTLIAMLHVPALPGTPHGSLPIGHIIQSVVAEAQALQKAGFHALLVENMHDRPYPRGAAPPEIVAALTAVCRAVREATGLPTGVQVLAAANREALAVALAAGLEFVRAEGFVFSHIADEGPIHACAAELLRYRRQIGADHVKVFADIKKKHASHALTADLDIAETARAAEFFLADGVVVTGTATGQQADAGDLAATRAATSLPVLVGSGATPANIARYFEHADAVIAGSSIKVDGDWRKPVDPQRATKLVAAAIS